MFEAAPLTRDLPVPQTDLEAHREDLLSWVRRQLIGPSTCSVADPDQDGILQGMAPIDRYPVGVLHPVQPDGTGEDPATLNDEHDEEVLSEMAADNSEAIAKPVRKRRYVPPSAVGFSFLVRGNVQLSITASAAHYELEDDRDEQGRFRSRSYRRRNSEISAQWPWPRERAPKNDCMAVSVQRRPWRDGTILTLTLVNRMPPMDERSSGLLFEAHLHCRIVGGAVAEYPRVDPALLTAEEQELELQYRHKRIYAIGHGAAVNWSVEPGKDPCLWSDFMPTVKVPLVSTTPAHGVDEGVLRFRFLASAPLDDILSGLKAFVGKYHDWIDAQQQAVATKLGSAAERAAGERICGRMRDAQGRMRRGINLLRDDAVAAQAFRWANQAMLAQMSQQDRPGGKGDDSYSWRPFQLAFLLTVMESTIREDADCRDLLDLIWFPTGGGKTEAYLGLTAFLILWRRLRHPRSGHGTVALMRYTLRLLTRQQFERATRIICALELLRRDHVEQLGDDDPISVGLWVGNAASPNRFDEAQQYVEKIRQGDGNAAHQLVLDACPWCGESFDPAEGYVANVDGFGFLCTNEHCEFGDGRALPCNVVDEALYRHPPSLLIATIDKFARLAWEPRAHSFFGGAHGARPPELVIQDELHLIAGPLGSVAGLYEAALETVLTRLGTVPKYIASTATVRMAADQVRALYGRELAVFPPPGLTADDSWFARTETRGPGRLYVGYLAPVLDQQRCLAPLAAALLAAPVVAFEAQGDRDALFDAWWTQVIYHGSLRGVGNSHNAYHTHIRDKLDRLFAELVERAKGQHNRTSGLRRGTPKVAQLTSRSTAQENARTFDRLALGRGHPGCLDAVLATNMISVGVDVDRLAVMVINGQPLTTAEYIQASSRIGRAGVPGLVFANYYRHQARSLSHYENFRPYHESFYRFIEPTGVTPYTYQVRKRALHAALVVALRHSVEGLRHDRGAGEFRQDDPAVRKVVDTLKNRCAQAAPSALRPQVANHIDELVQQWHDKAQRCRVSSRALLYQVRDNSGDRLLAQFRQPDRPGLWPTLNSMRNVEDAGVLKA